MNWKEAVAGIPSMYRANYLRAIADCVGTKVRGLVEIGCGYGDMSAILATAFPDAVLHLIDPWSNDRGHIVSSPGGYFYKEHESLDQVYVSVCARMADIDKGSGRIVIHREWSPDAAFAWKFLDTVDLVFIDANHSFAGCKNDIIAWKQVLDNSRAGRVGPGLLCGHDYGTRGVDQAIDFCFHGNVHLGHDGSWVHVLER